MPIDYLGRNFEDESSSTTTTTIVASSKFGYSIYGKRDPGVSPTGAPLVEVGTTSMFVPFLPDHNNNDAFPFFNSTGGNISRDVTNGNVIIAEPGRYKVQGFFEISVQTTANVGLTFASLPLGYDHVLLTSYPQNGQAHDLSAGVIQRYDFLPRVIEIDTPGTVFPVYGNFAAKNLVLTMWDHLFSVEYVGPIIEEI
jgi:hypothetical protein